VGFEIGMCAGYERKNIDILVRIEIGELLTKITLVARIIYTHFQLGLENT
jgi:hypothetical protein